MPLPGFVDLFGREPSGRATAPGRVNLMGITPITTPGSSCRCHPAAPAWRSPPATAGAFASGATVSG